MLVGVRQTHQKSPHVINLKNDKPASIWNDVEVFSEKKVEPIRREVVDLAGIVRDHAHEYTTTNNTNTKKRILFNFVSPISYLHFNQASVCWDKEWFIE